MHRDFSDPRYHRLIKRTRPERRLAHALEGVLSQDFEPRELARILVEQRICVPNSTMSCIELATDHLDKVRLDIGDSLITYVIYGGVAREPINDRRHKDIDVLVVTKREMKVPRLYRRINVQTVCKDLLGYDHLSKSTPAHLSSKMLKDDPAALRRTFALPIIPLYDTNDFVSHVRDIARKCLRVNDMKGYVDVHVANRLKLLRSAGKKLTSEDEAIVREQVLDELRVMSDLKTLL